MNVAKRSAAPVVVLGCLVACAAGCSPDRSGPAPAAPLPLQAPSASAATTPEREAQTSELGATSWQLVKIMSMDDTTYTPDDPSRYTLEFGADGSARVTSDCSEGTGSWSSESAGQLLFGGITTTPAECLPGSLHDRYLAQFPWVRSYVMQDGHLFLATMADGAIVEFEPAAGAP